MIRVFPRRTQWTPEDEKAFIGPPPYGLRIDGRETVRISVTFDRDRKEGERLYTLWRDHHDHVELGGPAYGDPGGEFEPGVFLKPGVTITSRGCPNRCPWCLVPKREGQIRELPIRRGHIIQDNNLLACSPTHIKKVFAMLKTVDQPVKFSGGFDPRLFNRGHADMLRNIKLGEVWFSLDSWASRGHLERSASLLKGIPRSKRRCFVLVGFNNETIEDADKRIRHAYNLRFDPFAQFYAGPGEQKKTKEWAAFCRTWSRPAAYRTLMKSATTQPQEGRGEG